MAIFSALPLIILSGIKCYVDTFVLCHAHFREDRGALVVFVALSVAARANMYGRVVLWVKENVFLQ